MDATRISEILKEAGVLQEGHFRLTSGKHSAKYMQCARLFQYAKYAQPLCEVLAEKFRDDEVDVVVGPAIGAIQMIYEVGRCLGVRNIFAERENNIMTLRRGFYIAEGERVLVLEDVVTTGGTVFEVIDLVKAAGGILVGVGSIVDRSNGMANFNTKFQAVYKAEIVSYSPDDCPLCRADMPISKPGSRKV